MLGIANFSCKHCNTILLYCSSLLWGCSWSHGGGIKEQVWSREFAINKFFFFFRKVMQQQIISHSTLIFKSKHISFDLSTQQVKEMDVKLKFVLAHTSFSDQILLCIKSTVLYYFEHKKKYYYSQLKFIVHTEYVYMQR